MRNIVKLDIVRFYSKVNPTVSSRVHFKACMKITLKKLFVKIWKMRNWEEIMPRNWRSFYIFIHFILKQKLGSFDK